MLKALQIKLFSFYCAPFLSLFMGIHNLCLKLLWWFWFQVCSNGIKYNSTLQHIFFWALGPLISSASPWPLTSSVLPGFALKLIPVSLGTTAGLTYSGQLLLLCGFPLAFAGMVKSTLGIFSRWSLLLMVLLVPYLIVKYLKYHPWYTMFICLDFIHFDTQFPCPCIWLLYLCLLDSCFSLASSF